MEKIKKLKPVRNILFKAFFVLVLSVLLLSGAGLFFIINKTAEQSLNNSIDSIQKMAVQSLSQDLLSGGYNEVFRKCNNLIEDQNIYSIKITSESDGVICSLNKKQDENIFSTKYSKIYFNAHKTELAATIKIQYITNYKEKILWNTLIIFTLSLIIITIVSFIISRKYGEDLLVNFNFLNNALETYRPDNYISNFEERPQNEIQEFHTLFKELYSMSTKLIDYEKKLIKSTKLIAAGELAAQVAHDIKSPLAALDMAIKDIGQLPETKRLMIRSASTRIRDIANSLLQKNRELSRKSNADQTNELVNVLLPVLIENILTEKRMQFRSKIGINIISNIGASSYGLFTKIIPREGKRIISNLLNNSIEASECSGDITIDLFSKDDSKIILQIKDEGKGIPPQLLPKLGQKGKTYGKKSGHGLGLYHARTSIESWRGSLEIESDLGKGTTVSIILPKSSPPQSFVPEIKFKPYSTIIIVDDDESIHQVWNERLESIGPQNNQIKVIHFSCPNEVYEWSKNNMIDHLTQFLIDYEYIGYKENGLDLIDHLDIGKNSFLVTSRFEEEQVQNRCDLLSVGLIPKEMAAFIPLSIQVNDMKPCNKEVSNILIDDDNLIRMVWELEAKKHNIPLKTYSLSIDLLNDLDNLSKKSIFYIDFELSDGEKGVTVAQRLFDQGHTNLYLATGYEIDSFELPSFIKGVQGKEPPWSQSR